MRKVIQKLNMSRVEGLEAKYDAELDVIMDACKNMQKRTPEYMRRADRAYRARRIAEGWEYLRIFAPAEIVTALKKEYQRLKYGGGQPVEDGNSENSD